MKEHPANIVIEILTHFVRLLSVSQVAELGFGHTKAPEPMALQWLRRRQRDGLTSVHELMLPPLPDVAEPRVDYQPGNPIPDFAALEWFARSRTKVTPSRTIVATATPKSRQQTGGPMGGRPIRPHEALHDLICASVYLHMRTREPELASAWVHEDVQQYTSGRRVPDAIIEGKEPIIVEIMGQYSSQKLREIHREYSGGRYRLY